MGLDFLEYFIIYMIYNKIFFLWQLKREVIVKRESTMRILD